MSASETDLFRQNRRSDWLRLRTLTLLRWVAIGGQIAAIAVASVGFGFRLEIGFAALVVGAAILANLLAELFSAPGRRLSEREAALMLVFDILQLGVLLALTGGLNNPFALLILAPVTIAATVLRLRSTLLLGAVAILIVSALGLWHLPILQADGTVLALPALFVFGFWVALVIGIVFLGLYARQVTTEMHQMRDALVATQLALAREQKLTDLGGVVAAAAHELGTPLATIKLVSSELLEELDEASGLREDVALIRDQADRCRDILRSMGRAGKEDRHLLRVPLETIVREAAEPHQARGRSVRVVIGPLDGAAPRQPLVERRPEIIHGLRNLIQNAVDFAETDVGITVGWTEREVQIRIEDDGPGFAPAVLDRIGDPFMRARPTDDRRDRSGYEGMGLGLFIAKTLLERTGARLGFGNLGRSGGGGARVEVAWQRSDIEAPPAGDGLGPNLPLTA